MTRNGADLLIETAETQGITTCFANPGTTELHLVDALGRATTMRTILTLFEGVASGAADGFARMARIPALGLFHLGPGYANSLANQHNARRHESPMINLIGDHATWHRHADAPLHSDISALTGWSGTTHPVHRAQDAGTVMQQAYHAAVSPAGGTGRTASIVFPTDAAWDPTEELPPAPLAPSEAATPHDDVVEAVANVLRRPGAAIIAGGAWLSSDSVRAIKAIETATGCAVYLSRVARLELGRDLPGYGELPYFPEPLRSALSNVSDAVLIGRSEPVTFFGYPDQPSAALPEGCRRHTLAGDGSDAGAALQALAGFLGVDPTSAPAGMKEAAARFDAAQALGGPLTTKTIGAVVATAVPEGAIVVGEAITSGAGYRAVAPFAAPHTLLSTLGGAIGGGLPAGVGAAVACPERPVLCFQADGSALYTIQSLWTMAREQLDVVVVICANRSYQILATELERAGMAPEGAARGLVQLTDPTVDFCGLAAGFGVSSEAVEDAEGLRAAIARSLAEPGPHLIEARMVG